MMGLDSINFTVECIENGFKVWKDKDGFINAYRKEEDDSTLKYQLTPYKHNFHDGMLPGQKVQVFENGKTAPGMAHRLKTFKIKKPKTVEN